MGKKAMYTEGKDYATGIGTHCLSHISPCLNETTMHVVTNSVLCGESTRACKTAPADPERNPNNL